MSKKHKKIILSESYSESSELESNIEEKDEESISEESSTNENTENVKTTKITTLTTEKDKKSIFSFNFLIKYKLINLLLIDVNVESLLSKWFTPDQVKREVFLFFL